MTHHPTASSVEARIFGELINVLYRQATPIFFGNIAVAALSVYLLWSQVAHPVLLSWAAAILLLTLIRIVIVRRDLHAVQPQPPGEARRRAWTYALFSGISGCLWGATGILFFAPDNAVVTVFICILLAGMTGGSVASQSSFPPAYYAFALPTVLPFALRSFVHGGPLFSVLGVLSLFLLGVNLAYSRNFHRTVREAVSLRFENTELIEQLQQEKERAESASRSKSQFLAAASHDLRQPAHALGLYIATLRAMCNAAAVSVHEVGAIAGKLQVALKGLVQLLDVLLDISKLDAGVVKVRREVFDVQELLETIDQQFSGVAAEQQLRFIVRPTAVLIQTDRALLHSILANFVSNALRYTERGKVLVGARRRGDFIGDRPGEFPAHYVMRQVGSQFQVWKLIQQMQGEIQIGGHAVAMRFDMQRDTRIIRQPLPAFDIGNAFGQRVGSHIGLQIDVIGAEFLHMRDDGLEFIDAARIALGLPAHVVRTQETGDFAHVIAVKETHTGAIEAGIADQLQFFIQRPFHTVRTTALHGPQGLIDKQGVHGIGTPLRSRLPVRRYRRQSRRNACRAKTDSRRSNPDSTPAAAACAPARRGCAAQWSVHRSASGH